MAAIAPCMAFVFAREGGYTADPNDRGNWTGGAIGKGELRGTKFGISAAAYPALDIASLTIDQAATILRPDYWDKVAGDDLPAGVDLMLVDHAFNCGPDASIKLLQDAVATRPDGVMGPITLAETAKRSPLLLISALAEAQGVAYRRMAAFPRYGKGWLNRVELRRQAAIALIPIAPPAPPPAPVPPTPAAPPAPNLLDMLASLLASLFARKA